MSPLPNSGDKCPTGCGRNRKHGQLMCPTCWREVPSHLQREVYRTWRGYSRAATKGADDFRERRLEYETAAENALAAVA